MPYILSIFFSGHTLDQGPILTLFGKEITPFSAFVFSRNSIVG